MRAEQAVIGKEEKETWDGGRVDLGLDDPDAAPRRGGPHRRHVRHLPRHHRDEAGRGGVAPGGGTVPVLIEATTAIVWNTPASGQFDAEQPGWTEFTGQTFDQLKGWGWLDAVHPDDRADTARAWSAAMATRSLYQVEHRLRRHDGEYRHMLVRAVPILDKGGGIREWVGVHTDIDAERRAEAAVREAEARARLLLESSGEGIFGIDTQGLCTFINRAAAEMLGYRAEDVLGRDAHSLFHHTRPDGSPYPVEDCPIYRTFRAGRRMPGG